MNQTFIKSLKLHHRRLYGTQNIPVKQLQQALKHVPQTKQNRFPAYSINNVIEEVKNQNQQRITFDQLINRMQRTLRDKKDNNFLDIYYDNIDQNGDGLISYEELLKVSSQITFNTMTQSQFLILCDKIGTDSTKFSKKECQQILREYL